MQVGCSPQHNLDGLKVKALAQTARDVGLSPAWCYTFPCLIVHSKEKFISYIT